MSTAIIDTSSLIALALAEQENEISHGDTYTFWRSHGGIDGAIEALILYDELVVDSPSIHRNADRLPRLQDYAERCRLIGTEEDFEDKVYRAVLSSYVPQVEVTDPGFRIPYSACIPKAGWQRRSELSVMIHQLIGATLKVN